MMRKDDNQYYWFSQKDLSKIETKLESITEITAIVDNILAELKVADVRADTSNIPMPQLRNALGLEPGSRPLWLSNEEYNFLLNMLK